MLLKCILLFSVISKQIFFLNSLKTISPPNLWVGNKWGKKLSLNGAKSLMPTSDVIRLYNGKKKYILGRKVRSCGEKWTEKLLPGERTTV